MFVISNTHIPIRIVRREKMGLKTPNYFDKIASVKANFIADDSVVC